MKLIDKYTREDSFNSCLIWIYVGNGRVAGIYRKNLALNKEYCCFEGYGYSYGIGCQTIWYPDLKAARKVVKKYLNGEIPNIPINIC